MIKKILLIAISLSLSLGAIPPDSIKLLECTVDDKIVLPSCFGEIQHNAAWLKLDAKCALHCQNFKELIHEQHEKNLPFLLAVARVSSKNGNVLQMYGAHYFNMHRYGTKYLFDLMKGQIKLTSEKDPRTNNKCALVDYYKLEPGAESFVYAGSSHNLSNIKVTFLDSFVHLEENAVHINYFGKLFNDGDRVEWNQVKARMLFQQAADLGNEDAKENLALMDGEAVWVAEDNETDIDIGYEIKPDPRINNPMYELGVMLYYGDEEKKIDPNPGLGKKWLHEAALLGNADAAALLEKLPIQ